MIQMVGHTRDQVDACFGLVSRALYNKDCLNLSVYVPEVQNNDEPEIDLLPVMVWFHGGGFTSGESNEALWGPGYLLDKDVVLVTVNYRLG